MKWHRSIFILLAYICGCGAVKVPSDDSVGSRRCQTDGLCITRSDTRFFQVGYRRDNLEIEVDIAYRPAISIKLNEGSMYCNRILFENVQEALISDNGNCPEEWLRRRPDSVGQEKIPEYEKLVQEFSTAIQAHDPPKRFAKVWRELKHEVKVLGEVKMILPPDAVGSSTRIELPEEARQQSSLKIVLAAIPGDSLAPPLPNDDHISDGSQKFPFSSAKGKTVLPSGQVHEDGYEFTQKISLWSQPTKMFLLFGKGTKKHHSGSVARIYRRQKGSDDDWRLYDIKVAGNHGSKPGYDRMREYAECSQLPVTSGYYSYGGECEGGWAVDHLCNDDTAYQIWHA